MIGKRFGKWLVLSHTAPSVYNYARVICRCVCGTTRPVLVASLKSGKSKSCGCTIKRKKVRQPRVDRRPDRQLPEYGIWNAMRQRCENPKDKRYHRYGGRGISVCKRWLVFDNFIADMGRRPLAISENGRKHQFTLERKKTDRGYSPRNCKWATYREQSVNTSVNRIIKFGNLSLPAVSWARKIGCDYKWLHRLIQQGLSIKEIMDSYSRRLSETK